MDNGPKLGDYATGQSPMAPGQPPLDIDSPPKRSPALHPSSFSPVLSKPLLNMDGAVNVDPDFFEGTDQDSSGLGPHFITMSVIKDKTKIHKQLISALSKTVTILTENLPNALVHCIKKTSRLPPLASATCSHFPTSGMQANNYMCIQNAWSLIPGIQNKTKMPAPKLGKDGRPIFNENRVYNGPDRITTILWITADCNVKDSLADLQMELEGKHLQLR